MLPTVPARKSLNKKGRGVAITRYALNGAMRSSSLFNSAAGHTVPRPAAVFRSNALWPVSPVNVHFCQSNQPFVPVFFWLEEPRCVCFSFTKRRSGFARGVFWLATLHSRLPIGAKTGFYFSPATLLAPGLVGAHWNPFFGLLLGDNGKGSSFYKKMAVFYGQMADFWPIFTKSGPPKAQMS